MSLILVAPDSFKGSLAAGRVAEIVAEHLRPAAPSATVVELPMAVVGSCRLSPSELADAGIDQVYALTDLEPDATLCMANAEGLLHRVADRLGAELAPRTANTPTP